MTSELLVLSSSMLGVVESQPARLRVGSSILNRTILPTGDAVRVSGFNLQVETLSGRAYRVEWSADLVVWHALTTFDSTGAVLEFLDTQAVSQNQRYYKVVELPAD